MGEQATGPKRIALFGHFDGTNFGNECTLQTVLYHLYRFQPDAYVTCICSGPQITADAYNIEAIPITAGFLKSWVPRYRFTRMMRKICAALREPCEWLKGIRNLKGADMLIIPGTGLLTDAYGLRSWGPYGLLKWSLIAKVCGSKLVLLSVGAGPIYGIVGKSLIKLILALADFRSYRDASTVQYLKGIGLAKDDEQIYPDLVFSLPKCWMSRRIRTVGCRPVVGLGLMEYAGKYSARQGTETIFTKYLGALVEAAEWLLRHGYDIRLLSGDVGDSQARRSFRRLLKERCPAVDDNRIVDVPVSSVADLLSQIAMTDFVVATRFHNLVLGFLCGKPVISISFHHKCESLMATMKMSDYCLRIDELQADELIDTFCQLETNANMLRALIRGRIEAFRLALDWQYAHLFRDAERGLRTDEATTDGGLSWFLRSDA